MEQFTGPLAPPPPWLDPLAKVTGPEPPKLSRDAFPVMCVDTLLSLGCPIAGACEIAGNAITESGWGQQYRANNLSGVKATKGWAERYKARTGHSAPWWPAHGNVGTGDSHTVFYRGYTSIRDHFDEWLLTFVPKPGTVGNTHLYKRTGELFWSGGDWFPELIKGGYKGSVTKAKPTRSISEHVSLTNSARTRWVQSRLGVVVDGKWGPKSQKALDIFAASHDLPSLLTPAAPVLAALAAHTSPAFHV